MYKQSIASFAKQLIDDGITEYGDLISNKDMLIRLLTCAVENDNFKFISENSIQDLLEKAIDLNKLDSDNYTSFNTREF